MPMEHQGNATFQIDDKPCTFRYKIKVASMTLQIWIEDVVTKEQLQTKELQTEDFVSSENLLTQATINDYGAQFAECLRTKDVQNKTLSAATDSGDHELEIHLILDASSFAATLVYAFRLTAVPLERVDVLAAQLRDAMDNMEAMQDKIATMELQISAQGAEITRMKEAMNDEFGYRSY